VTHPDPATLLERHPDSAQLRRQWALLRMLADAATPFGVKELAAQLGVSKATVQRDLATLHHDFALIEECVGKQKKTYRIDQQIRALEAIKFGPAELLAVYAACSTLDGLDGTLLHEDLHGVRQKIRGFLGPQHNGGLQAITEVFKPHTRGAVDYEPQRELIDELVDAIAHKKVCTVTYEAKWKGTTRTHRARPLRLIWHQSSLYLLACLGEHERITTLVVHRIRALEVTADKFKAPKLEVSVDDYTQRAFGIFVNDAEEDVEIIFDQQIAWRIKERRFHPAEHHEELADGALRYTVRSSAMWEILPWVMGFGPLAELRAPAAWRAQLCANVEAMRARYAGG
jgi:predicted DNA-binding transcriptional regulator YafY